MAKFFVAQDDGPRGPFSVDQMHARVVRLTPATLVWRRGMSEWAEASSVTELATPLSVADEEPPAYRPTGSPGHFDQTTKQVSRWVYVHAVGITPLFWLAQRSCNIVELMSERPAELPNAAATMAIWAALTLSVVGLVIFGGLGLENFPSRRPRLLCAALGAKLLVGGLVIAYGLVVVTAQVAHQRSGPEQSGDDAAAYAVLVGAALCLLNTAMDAAAWVRLRQRKAN